MPFERALSTADHAACDRMCARVMQSLQTARQLGRPWNFEAVFMGVLWAHEALIDQVRIRLETVRAETHRREPDGNPPD
jgi:hypothetical protein